MTKPRILSERRPSGWDAQELLKWDRQRQDAEQRFADWLFTCPVDSLSTEDWEFLDNLPQEIPI